MSEDLLNKKLPELREDCRARGLNAEETANRQELIKRIMLYDAGMMESDLPEPGYKRDEVLARRQDVLEERADTADEDTGVHRIDPEALKEDREILYKSIDKEMVKVTDKQDGYMYAWTYYGQNGQMVIAKRALGWRVVTGSDPECIEHKEADGTRRIGDTLLMRIPIERWHRLEEDAQRRRNLQYDGIGSRLRELADRGRSHGIKLHEDISTVNVGNQTLMDVVEKRSGAHKTAMDHIDKKLRDGTVPGVPAPKKK